MKRIEIMGTSILERNLLSGMCSGKDTMYFSGFLSRCLRRGDCKNRGDIAGEVGRNIRWVRSELPGGERGEALRGLGAKF